MKIENKIDRHLTEAKEIKLSKSKAKWALVRTKTIESALKGLQSGLNNLDMDEIRIDLGNIQSTIDVIKQGLGT